MALEYFIKKLVCGRKIILGFIVAWLIVVSVFLLIYPPQFEAKAAIRMGTVLSRPIETVQSAMVRLRSNQTLRTALNKINPLKTEELLEVLNKNLRIQPIDERTLQLSLRLGQQKYALEILDQLGQEFIRQHKALSTVMIEGAKEGVRLIEKAKSEVTANAFMTKPTPENLVRAPSDNLIEREVDVRMKLLPPFTEVTNFLIPVEVSDRPVSPRPVMCYILAVLLGLVCAVIRIFAYRTDTDSVAQS